MAKLPGWSDGSSSSGIKLESASQLWEALKENFITPKGRIEWSALGTGLIGGLILLVTHLQLLGQEAIQRALELVQFVTLPGLQDDVEGYVTDVGAYLSGLFDPFQGFGVLSYPMSVVVALATFAILALGVRWAWRFFGGDS